MLNSTETIYYSDKLEDLLSPKYKQRPFFYYVRTYCGGVTLFYLIFEPSRCLFRGHTYAKHTKHKQPIYLQLDT